jgi:hypothetical protein
MPKRSRKQAKKTPPASKKKKARDPNQAAFDAVQKLLGMGTTPEGKNPLAVALGRLGGLKGGRARADNMTEEQRRESAKKAAAARWQKSSK